MQHVRRSAAEDELPNARVAVGAHHQQVGSNVIEVVIEHRPDPPPFASTSSTTASIWWAARWRTTSAPIPVTVDAFSPVTVTTLESYRVQGVHRSQVVHSA